MASTNLRFLCIISVLEGGGPQVCASALLLLIFRNIIIIMILNVHRVAYDRFCIPDAGAEKMKVLVFKS